MGVVQQAVHRGAGEELVAEERVPLLDRAVRRDDQRTALVAAPDELVEVERFFVSERPQAEIVEDQQVGVAREAREASLVAVVGPRGAPAPQSARRGGSRA